MVFLAVGTGWFLQTRLEKSRTDKARELLTTGICDDLNHSLSLYEKVEEEWDKTKTIWFSTLNELKESRQTYKDNRNWIVWFESPDLRKRIFRYYLRSAELIDTLEWQQGRKYELESKFNNLVNDIKMRDPGLKHNDVSDIAISYMQSENTEYVRLEGNLPEYIKKLASFKGEAKQLLSELKGKWKP